MRRLLPLLILIAVLGTSGVFAQTKKGGGGSAPGKPPTAKDPSIVVNVFMRDAAKNEVLVATRIFPNSPEYNSVALARFFAVMKALEPQYKQDDDVAYTWSTKGKVTKCSIYLESWDADVKTGGTGTVVGCEANGVSGIPVTSGGDGKKASSSADPKHLSETMDLFKKQWERAKASLGGKG
jgi:hypothetical protein